MDMEKWVKELFEEAKSLKMPNGLLVVFNRIYKKTTEVKLKINELTGLIEIRSNSNCFDTGTGKKLVNFETAKKNQMAWKNAGDVKTLFEGLAILEDTEKEFQKLLITTELKPHLVSDLKIIHGNIFSIAVTKRAVMDKLNGHLEKILGAAGCQEAKKKPPAAFPEETCPPGPAN